MLLQDYNQDIFETFAAIIFIYIVTFPIMAIAIFWIKLRNEFDVLLYCLLLGLLASIYTAVDLVIELSK